MIGRLRGIILEKNPPQLLLEVNGIGYEIAAPMTTFYHLPELNQTTSLYTHLVVREDTHSLYGFYCIADRRLFRALIKVSGVGPKLALSILSSIEAERFVLCIQQNDSSNLTSIPGIGKKTAQRLLLEMRDALSSWQSNTPATSASDSDVTINNQQLQDAISALAALGYKPQDAKRAINKIYDSNLSREQLIRKALQTMAQGVT